MSVPFWRSVDGDKARDVSEEWALPVGIYVGEPDGGAEVVSEGRPLPVKQAATAIKVNTTSSVPAQVVVSTSVVTLIAPANPNRTSLLLTNLTGTQICHLGDQSVSATTSRLILTGAVGSNVTIFARDAVYGLSATAAQTVLVWEEMLA